MASPFSSFSAKGFQQTEQRGHGPSPLAQSNLQTPFQQATPASTSGKAEEPSLEGNNAMKTDVYRSYSLMDVAFWDFGKRAPGESMWSKWWGTGSSKAPGPASIPEDGVAACTANGSCAMQAGSPAGSGASLGSGGSGLDRSPGSSSTWGKWLYGSK